MTATWIPAFRTCWIPNPSRTWNTLSASPRGPKCSRPSVMTPSTSSTRRRMAAAAFRDMSELASHDSGAEEVVDVEGADQASVFIRDSQRRDAMEFHQVHGLCRQLPRTYGFAVAGHYGAHRRLVHVDPPVERTAQITVSEHSQDPIVAIDDHRHPQPFAGHFQQALAKGGFRRNAGNRLSHPHEIFYVQQQLAAERSARMGACKVLLREAT